MLICMPFIFNHVLYPHILNINIYIYTECIIYIIYKYYQFVLYYYNIYRKQMLLLLNDPKTPFVLINRYVRPLACVGPYNILVHTCINITTINQHFK